MWHHLRAQKRSEVRHGSLSDDALYFEYTPPGVASELLVEKTVRLD
jgi:hypothetical protein